MMFQCCSSAAEEAFMWIPLQEWMGKRGTENGIVIKDEEYKQACRITLEKCKQYYAVTCGVYTLTKRNAKK